MKILYIGNHSEAEYHEVTLLQDAGFEVFSLGEQLLQADLPNDRKIKGFTVDSRLEDLFWEFHPNYVPGKLIKLKSSFIEHFDLFVFSDYPEHLSLNFKLVLRANKALLWVWRKRPKATPVHYQTVLNLKGKGVKTLELPYGGKYKVTECKKVWLEKLRRLGFIHP
ncbi:MAG: hypothetical protein DRQ40_03465 [Gammaproteobacteria bacterium]|nr:MAG: hypothetical protein DRQ40_03465 [Gammaproteobacteria bacterium]